MVYKPFKEPFKLQLTTSREILAGPFFVRSKFSPHWMMASVLQSRNVVLVVVEVSALIVLNLMSLMGNTLVCMSVYRNTQLRTTTNLYIMALAISDLLSAVFVMPFVTAVLVRGHWIFGEVICDVLAFFSAFIIYVSPVTMGLTAVNRYVRM